MTTSFCKSDHVFTVILMQQKPSNIVSLQAKEKRYDLLLPRSSWEVNTVLQRIIPWFSSVKDNGDSHIKITGSAQHGKCVKI